MHEFQFLAKLYGVRGSYPISPEIPTKVGGNTTCLLIRTPEHIVIFDAGSGITKLGKDLMPEIIKHKKDGKGTFHITLIFTHTHIDHLLGLPFFAPIYIPDVNLHLIGPATMGAEFEDILRTIVEPQYFPVSMDEFRSDKNFYNLNENMLVYFAKGEPGPYFARSIDPDPESAELIIRNMKYYFHPKDGSYPLRAEWNNKKVVLATDVEQYVGGDQRLINFAKDADVLIHDAQYTEDQYKQFSGYGHSSVAMACDAAKQANAKKLLLFHHDPSNADDILYEMEKQARSIFPQSELATENWEWKL